MADSNEMPFEMVGRVGPNNWMLWAYIGSVPMWKGAIFAEMQRKGRMCSGDAALPKLLLDFLLLPYYASFTASFTIL